MPATPTAESRMTGWKNLLVRAWALIGVLLLLIAAGWLLSKLTSAILPFAFGLLVVLLLRSPVALLARRMPRIVAVTLCYVIAILLVAVALTFIIPPIVAQVGQFVAAVPRYTQQLFELWDANIAHPTKGNGVPGWLQDTVIAIRDYLTAHAESWSAAIAAGAVSAGGSIATGLFSMLLALVVGFYALVDLPHLQSSLFRLAGARFRHEVTHLARTTSLVLGGWLKGVLIESSIMAVLVTIVLSIVGLPYALALGVIAGIFNIVPWVGPFIVLILVTAAGYVISPWTAVWALIAVIAVQQLDALVVQPRVMAKHVDLHPLLVIFALLVGAALFGVPGMAISIPVAALAKGIAMYWYESRGAQPDQASPSTDVA